MLSIVSMSAVLLSESSRLLPYLSHSHPLQLSAVHSLPCGWLGVNSVALHAQASSAEQHDAPAPGALTGESAAKPTDMACPLSQPKDDEEIPSTQLSPEDQEAPPTPSPEKPDPKTGIQVEAALSGGVIEVVEDEGVGHGSAAPQPEPAFEQASPQQDAPTAQELAIVPQPSTPLTYGTPELLTVPVELLGRPPLPMSTLNARQPRIVARSHLFQQPAPLPGIQ